MSVPKTATKEIDHFAYLCPISKLEEYNVINGILICQMSMNVVPLIGFVT